MPASDAGDLLVIAGAPTVVNQPRAADTGLPLPPDARQPAGDHRPTIGRETQAPPPADPPPPPAAPPQPAPARMLPPDPTRDSRYLGLVRAGAPPEGRPIPPDWDGESEPVPGQRVIYWLADHPDAPFYPHLAEILEPTRGTDGAPTGAWSGLRFRPVAGGVFKVHAARPSRVPKNGHFTPRRVYPPEALRPD